ncbi:hypothetical protein C8J57DRAFT_1464846 [Mycena rebaudengoi]|nr:hypothetical protein C8J57DRAFT_1464846 [Mycena rebaudengoi]
MSASSCSSLLPRQCAHAPADLHDREGPALISYGHLPAASYSSESFCAAAADHAYTPSLSLHMISLRRHPPVKHTHKTDAHFKAHAGILIARATRRELCIDLGKIGYGWGLAIEWFNIKPASDALFGTVTSSKHPRFKYSGEYLNIFGCDAEAAVRTPEKLSPQSGWILM